MFSGPMKEEDVTPGTIYPLMGKLLCFLPERLRRKLCCVTPQTVSRMSHNCTSCMLGNSRDYMKPAKLLFQIMPASTTSDIQVI